MQSIFDIGDFYVQNNTLTQAGYGQPREAFVQFMTKLNSLQKDIVLIGPDTKEVIGDSNNKYIKRKPDISGNAYKYLIRLLEMNMEGRKLNFLLLPLLVAKTFVPEISLLKIHHFEVNDFDGTLARLIQKAKERINAKPEVARVVENYQRYIDSFKHPADFVGFMEQLKVDQAVTEALQPVIRAYASGRMKELGIEYDKFKFKEGYEEIKKAG